MDSILEVDEYGNLHGLYTDDIDLFSIGRLTNVVKASNVEFNESSQLWEVSTLDGDVLYTSQNRQNAIEWEIREFSPGGCRYDRSRTKTL